MPNLTDIPGISQIWTRTKGDPKIKIAILDGAADLERSCFQGANFSQFKPYWSGDTEGLADSVALSPIYFVIKYRITI